MPVLVVAAAVAALLLACVLLVPLSLVLRYRAGTARRAARPWVAAVNAGAIAVSAAFLLGVAAVTSVWVPDAFGLALLGLGAGILLGLLGLVVSRWEEDAGVLHYTPSRLLILAVTLVVTARLAYGFWRAWNVWRSAGDTSWLVAFGPAWSLAAGALVLGYFAAWWIGVWRRIRRHRGAA